MEVLLYSLISILIISLASLIGIIFLSVKSNKLENFLIYSIAFSAGTLLGDVFMHLLPEAVKKGFNLQTSFFILFGIGFSLGIEKIIRWRHCHYLTSKNHPHHLSTMNLVGEGFHNFIDGIIIGGSYLASIPIGIATTIAVLFHEIPQEIGDFGVLVYAGFSKRKALITNFLISLTSLLGLSISLLIGFKSQVLISFLIPFAIGNFIYIATADLIPEMHKEPRLKSAVGQIMSFTLGVAVMGLMLLIE